MSLTASPLRSYRAHIVPAGVDADQVEALASAGALTPIRVKAANCAQAQFAA